jgi:hypothetical protein
MSKKGNARPLIMPSLAHSGVHSPTLAWLAAVGHFLSIGSRTASLNLVHHQFVSLLLRALVPRFNAAGLERA